jgi:guanidinobutyrase
VADVGDVPINTYNLQDSIGIIEAFYDGILAHGCKPMTLGGDHTIALPILRALRKKYGPLGMVHVDAHADINDAMFGEPIAHGTPFRRAVEEGLLEGRRVVQIGLRGTGYTAEDFDWPRSQGFRVVQAEDCWYRSLAPLMGEVRAQLGPGPVYLSFDIDGIDPAFAPGTGTPEIAGLTVPQALEVIRGCRGLDVVGGDVVEISPPYDLSGNTALLGANLLFEMLCVLPGVSYRE